MKEQNSEAVLQSQLEFHLDNTYNNKGLYQKPKNNTVVELLF